MKWLTRNALEALMPSDGDLDGVGATHLEEFLDRYYREAPLLLRGGLTAAALLYQAAPILTVHRPLPAFLLNDELGRKHASRMAYHPVYPIRMSTFTLKMIAGLCWGADPAVRQKLGLDPLEPDPGTWVDGAP